MPKVKIRYFAAALAMLAGTLPIGSRPVAAASCPELKVIFARGSGEAYQTGESYLALKSSLGSKLAQTRLGYEFKDLDYPAVGIRNVWTVLGALFGGGEAYEFGRSVNTGTDRLVAEVNGSCRNTKYVVAGYSQGAMTVSKALRELDNTKVIYAATFGDPKIYLPEGAGAMPIACQGLGLSTYRRYVPDCRAYLGKLGTYLPYQPSSFEGKLGTWCNKMDIFCSSYLSIASHTSYVADELYEDASKVIFDKITEAFGIENSYIAPHQTAILIDSTYSMDQLIKKYKAEAIELARRTLVSGGEVALYEYRDYQGSNALTRRCDFGCTLEEFKAKIDSIRPAEGGDELESALGASFAVMSELNWRLGATKSLVILTDAGYHAVDFDDRKTTLEDVVRLSRQIDPVNIYVVTTEEVAEAYEELTHATGGRVATTAENLWWLTQEIMARYDALPQVEEWLDDGAELPWVELEAVETQGAATTVKFHASHGRVMVALGDMILGVVEGGEFTITELDRGVENTLTLIPITETRSGEAVSVIIEAASATPPAEGSPFIPKTPDTGVVSGVRLIP